MSEDEDVFRGYGVEIKIENPDDFLVIRETLTRIGIPVLNEKKLLQSCHILHKRGRYAIMHFKEMFGMDGKQSNISKEDLMRRNTIVSLIEDWGLCEILNPGVVLDKLEASKVKVLSHSEKQDWNLQAKYHFGVFKRKN